MKNILFFSLIILLAATSCRRVFGKKVKGSGNVTTETRQIGGFTSVDVSSSIDLYLSQDSSYSVRVETDDNIIKHIETYEEGGVLYIEIEKNFNPRPSNDIKVHVSAPALRKITASGACDVFSSERLTYAEGFSLKLSGASDGELDVKAPKLTANLTGAGKLKLKGETRDLEIKGTGSSEIEGFEMMAENVSVKITGAGDADVFASVSLDVNVTGSGSVRYKGSPSVSQKISGAGSLKKVP
jgi:hypothetical protein